MAAARTLRVCTNPYLATDADKRPCFAVHIDPYDPRYPKDVRGWRGWVGAKIVSSVMIREGDESRGGLRANRHDTVWGFIGEAIELPDTTYYRRMVADGDLLPADEQTAKTCRAPFRDVATVRFETQLANEAQDAVWLDETNGD